MHLSEKTSDAISHLVNEVAEENPEGVMRWHNELYKIGKPAVGAIKKNMLEINKVDMRREHKHQYIVHLAGVLHDIDEQACRDVTIQLVDEGCDRSVIYSLRSLNEFTYQNFIKYRIHKITVFQHKKFRQTERIKLYLHKWLNRIDDNDLKGINRMYIMDKMIHHRGSYTPIYDIIRLVWSDVPDIFFLFRFFPMAWNEFVLYHEIGHYVNNHTWGQDIEQEKEADAYALAIFSEHYPFYGRYMAECVKSARKRYLSRWKRR